MECHVEHTRFTGPVTALDFAQIDGRPVLLSGEGPNLKVLVAQDEPKVLAQARVFRTQAIHGIVALRARAPDHLAVVVWGGPYVRVACLRWPDWRIDCSSRCRSTPHGWIIAADVDDAHRWGQPSGYNYNYSPSDPRVVLVTARSALLLLHVSLADRQCHLQELNASTNAILYSASICWAARNRILLASGTAFGDVSLHLFGLTRDRDAASVNLLMHEAFSAHDGSVFGLHMAKASLVAGGQEQALLASCSDDRSIRVWEITEYMAVSGKDTSEATVEENRNDIRLAASEQERMETKPNRRMVCVWAHQSRIWGVRFISSTPQGHDRNVSVDLLSFGEDASCQHWRLSRHEKPADASTAASGTHYSLEHQTTKVLHSGKNIWSFAVAKLEPSLSIAATGGADGRIIYFTLKGANHSEEVSVPATNGTGDEASHIAMIRTGPAAPASRSKDLLVSKAFRSYRLVDVNVLLAATDEGSILLGTIRGDENLMQMTLLESGAGGGRATLNEHSIQWAEIAQLETLKSYSILATCHGCGFACISTADHAVYFFDLARRRLELLEQGRGKVINVLCQHTAGFIHVNISYLGVASCSHWKIRIEIANASELNYGTPEVEHQSLPPGFIITSMAVPADGKNVILGARNGTLAAYRLGSSKAILLPSEAHRGDAVTCILPLSSGRVSGQGPGRCLFLTTGRNGCYAVHQLSFTEPGADCEAQYMAETLHTSTAAGIAMLEGAYLSASTKDLILYGFREKSFIVWNDTQLCEIMKVSCGGAHRRWDFCPARDSDAGGAFVWTQASAVYLGRQQDVDHKILQAGTHGREIKAVAVSPTIAMSHNRTLRIMATGAEDTTIRLVALYDALSHPVRHEKGEEEEEEGPDAMIGSRNRSAVVVIKKHTTGIQALRWSRNGAYLFSSGGFEEFFVWRVRYIAGYGIGVVCEAACPAQSDVPDLRVTDFDACPVTLGSAGSDVPLSEVGFLFSMSYSDSSVRVFFYNGGERAFHLLFTGNYATCCLTHIAHVRLTSGAAGAATSSGLFFLCSAGTDGYLALWDVTGSLRDARLSVGGDGSRGEEDALHFATATTTTTTATKALLPPPERAPPPQIRWHQRVRAHAGAVMCLDTVRVAPHAVLVASGGDDGSICLTRYALDPSSPPTTTTTTTKPSCSQTIMVRAHACAITAIALLPASNTGAALGAAAPAKLRARSASPRSFCMATSGKDQRLRVWSFATTAAEAAATGTRGRRNRANRGTTTAVTTTAAGEKSGGGDGGNGDDARHGDGHVRGNGNGSGSGSGSGSGDDGDDDDIVNIRLQADMHTAVASVSAMVAVLPASPPLLRGERGAKEDNPSPYSTSLSPSSLALCGVGIDQWDIHVAALQ